MVIDCERCVVRGLACGECVVSVLLGGPPEDVAVDNDFAGYDPGGRDPAGCDSAGDDFAGYDPAGPGRADPLHVDAVEVAALGALAAGGLVPPLRLVLPDTGTG